MKILLITSALLFIFAIAMMLSDLYCKIEAKAQKLNTAHVTEKQPCKLLYVVFNPGSNHEYLYTANADGTNPKPIHIKNLPKGMEVGADFLAISPDHKTIFFDLVFLVNEMPESNLYTCDIDGSNLHPVFNNNNNAESLGIY